MGHGCGRPSVLSERQCRQSQQRRRNISGISHPLKAGDVIGVQHGDKKARFKVIWVIDAGVARQIEAGVQILPNQQSPWQELAKPQKS